MDRIGYKVVLNFANMHGVEVEKREINGVVEDVMIVPIRINGIVQSRKKGNKGLFLNGYAYPNDGNCYNQSHYLIASPRKSVQEELSELGFRPKFIFGNMSYMFVSKQKHTSPANLSNIDNILNSNDDNF